jgi:hypothetical protein
VSTSVVVGVMQEGGHMQLNVFNFPGESQYIEEIIFLHEGINRREKSEKKYVNECE